MAKCPYCGRKTARTIDWCCQYCGYPLLSRRYRKIYKSYKQLKEERLRKPVVPRTVRPAARMRLPAWDKSVTINQGSGEACEVSRSAIIKPSFITPLLYLGAVATTILKNFERAMDSGDNRDETLQKLAEEYDRNKRQIERYIQQARYRIHKEGLGGAGKGGGNSTGGGQGKGRGQDNRANIIGGRHHPLGLG